MASLHWQEMARTRPFMVELDGLTAPLLLRALALLDSDIGKKIRVHGEAPTRGSLHFQALSRADAQLAIGLAKDVEKALRGAQAADEESDARFEVVQRRSA